MKTSSQNLPLLPLKVSQLCSNLVILRCWFEGNATIDVTSASNNDVTLDKLSARARPRLGSISRYPSTTEHKLSLPDIDAPATVATDDVITLSPPTPTNLRSSFHGLSSPRLDSGGDAQVRASSDSERGAMTQEMTSDGEKRLLQLPVPTTK